jgi:hypothetical protein
MVRFLSYPHPSRRFFPPIVDGCAREHVLVCEGCDHTQLGGKGRRGRLKEKKNNLNPESRHIVLLFFLERGSRWI